MSQFIRSSDSVLAKSQLIPSTLCSNPKSSHSILILHVCQRVCKFVHKFISEKIKFSIYLMSLIAASARIQMQAINGLFNKKTEGSQRNSVLQ